MESKTGWVTNPYSLAPWSVSCSAVPLKLSQLLGVEAGIVLDEGLQRLQGAPHRETGHPEALHGDDVGLVLAGDLRGELVPVVREGDGLQLHRDVRVLLVHVFGETLPDLGLLGSIRPHRPSQLPRGASATTAGPGSKQADPGETGTAHPQEVPAIHRPPGENCGRALRSSTTRPTTGNHRALPSARFTGPQSLPP